MFVCSLSTYIYIYQVNKRQVYAPSNRQSQILIAHFHSLTWQSHQPLPGKNKMDEQFITVEMQLQESDREHIQMMHI